MKENKPEKQYRKIQRNVKLAEDIGNKIVSLGMKHYPSGIGADLSDIYLAMEDYKAFVDKLLKLDINDPKIIGNTLVEIQVELNHINWHIKESKSPLQRAINYCFEQSK
jgi:hypothetical protein